MIGVHRSAKISAPRATGHCWPWPGLPRSVLGQRLRHLVAEGVVEVCAEFPGFTGDGVMQIAATRGSQRQVSRDGGA